MFRDEGEGFLKEEIDAHLTEGSAQQLINVLCVQFHGLNLYPRKFFLETGEELRPLVQKEFTFPIDM